MKRSLAGPLSQICTETGKQSQLYITTLNENTVMYITLLFLNLLTGQLKEKKLCLKEKKEGLS